MQWWNRYFRNRLWARLLLPKTVMQSIIVKRTTLSSVIKFYRTISPKSSNVLKFFLTISSKSSNILRFPMPATKSSNIVKHIWRFLSLYEEVVKTIKHLILNNIRNMFHNACGRVLKHVWPCSRLYDEVVHTILHFSWTYLWWCFV